jgi:hypothetical protein
MSDRADTFRILSLDGGGTWALIQVKALMRLYPAAVRGHDILRRFDLAIANSGGSIVLAALAADMELASILDLFLQEGARRKMFVNCLWGAEARRVGFGPRYEAAAKLEGLREVLGKAFGDQPMSAWGLPNVRDRQVRLVICGFDYERLREVFFRTRPEIPEEPPVPSQRAVTDATFAEAVHASSNAPILYFNAPAKFGPGLARFWDGAMGGYNNPVLAGVVEALRDGAGDPSRVRVLSLGTGSVALPEIGTASDSALLLPKRDESLLTYAQTASTCILDDPPDAASYVAHVVLGGRTPRTPGEVVGDGPVVRLSPLLQPVRGQTADWQLPDGLSSSEFHALTRTDLDAVADDEVQRIATFADLWLAGKAGDDGAVRNQPIRGTRWLQVEIGHGTFGEAMAAWQAVDVQP